MKSQGKPPSADQKAAEAFPHRLKDLIEGKGFIPSQIFNVDETGLFWKRMPSRTFFYDRGIFNINI